MKIVQDSHNNKYQKSGIENRLRSVKTKTIISSIILTNNFICINKKLSLRDGMLDTKVTMIHTWLNNRRLTLIQKGIRCLERLMSTINLVQVNSNQMFISLIKIQQRDILKTIIRHKRYKTDTHLLQK